MNDSSGDTANTQYSAPTELGEQQPIHAQQVDEASGSATGQQVDMQQSADSTEEGDVGGEPKRFQGDDASSSLPHGDVAPPTLQSEAGQELLDNTPYERMMSPNKSAKHGDDPDSVNLLGHLFQIERLDIEPEVAYEDQDRDTVMQSDLNLKEDPEEPISDITANLKELRSNPCTSTL